MQDPIDESRDITIQGLKFEHLGNGDFFIGNMVFGRPHGPGKISYSPEDPYARKWYKGEFEHGTRHGHGAMAWQDGLYYEGEWRDDQPQGFGAEIYPDGSYYLGQFSQDCRNGYGLYVYPGGNIFAGYWKHDTQDGIGFATINNTETVVEYHSGELQAAVDETVSKQALDTLSENLESATTYATQVQMRVRDEWKAVEFIDDIKVPDRPQSAGTSTPSIKKVTRFRSKGNPTSGNERGRNPPSDPGNLDQVKEVDLETDASKSTPEEILALEIERIQRKLLSKGERKADGTSNTDVENTALVPTQDLLQIAEAAIASFEAGRAMLQEVLGRTARDIEQLHGLEDDAQNQAESMVLAKQQSKMALNEPKPALESYRQNPITSDDVSIVQNMDNDLSLIAVSPDPPSQIPSLLNEILDLTETIVSDVVEKAKDAVVSDKESGPSGNSLSPKQSVSLSMTQSSRGQVFPSPAFKRSLLREGSITRQAMLGKEFSEEMQIVLKDMVSKVQGNMEDATRRMESVVSDFTSAVNTLTELQRSKDEQAAANLSMTLSIHKEMKDDFANAVNSLTEFQRSKDEQAAATLSMTLSTQKEMKDNFANAVNSLTELQRCKEEQAAATLSMTLSTHKAMKDDFANAVNSLTELQRFKDEQAAATLSMTLSFQKEIKDAMLFMRDRVSSMEDKLGTVQEVQANMRDTQSALRSQLKDLIEVQLPSRLESGGRSITQHSAQDMLSSPEKVLSSDQMPEMPSNRPQETVVDAEISQELPELPNTNVYQSKNVQVVDEVIDSSEIFTAEGMGVVVDGVISNIVEDIKRMMDHRLSAEDREDDILHGVRLGVSQIMSSLTADVVTRIVSEGADTRALVSEQGQKATKIKDDLNQVAGTVLGSHLGTRDLSVQDFKSLESLSMSADEQDTLVVPVTAQANGETISTSGTKKALTPLKRVLSVRSRQEAEFLESESQTLLSNLSDQYVLDILRTLDRWSAKNAVANDLHAELKGRLSDSDSPREAENPLSARSLKSIVDLAKEAETLLLTLGETHIHSLSSEVADSLRAQSPLMALISREIPDVENQPSANDVEIEHVESPKQILIRYLSAQSVRKLESLLIEGRTLLSSIDSASADIMTVLQENSSSNLVAASLYHAVFSLANADEIDTKAPKRELSANTRDMLVNLLEQGTLLMSNLQKADSDDILSDILRSSGARTPLAAILYRELCKIHPNTPKNPAALRRLISARTKRNLDSLLADGKSLLEKLNSDVSDDFISQLHDQATLNPLASLLLYDVLVSEAPVVCSRTRTRLASARCRSEVEGLMKEGKDMLAQLNNQYAEEILSTISENSLHSPIAKMLSYEIFSTRSRPATEAAAIKRALSARSRKGLQELLFEGRALLSKMNLEDSNTVMSKIYDNVQDNALAGVLYYDIITNWFGADVPEFGDIPRSKRALSARTRGMLMELINEGNKLLDNIGSSTIEDMIPDLLESRARSPLSAYLIQEMLEWSIHHPSDGAGASITCSDLRGRLKDLMSEGQGLMDRLESPYFEDILDVIGTQVKGNPLSTFIYHEIMRRKEAFGAGYLQTMQKHEVRHDSTLQTLLDSKTREQLADLVQEGQRLFETFGDKYSKSLLTTIMHNAGTNPIATLLYSDNLMSIAHYNERENVPESSSSDTIKRALSARSRRAYDDVLNEGRELLGNIDPSLAGDILTSMCTQTSILSSGLLSELIQFIPDDTSQSSLSLLAETEFVETSLSEDFTSFEMSGNSAALILQSAFRCRLSRRILKEYKSLAISNNSCVLLQCAWRSHLSRKSLCYWRQVLSFFRSLSHRAENMRTRAVHLPWKKRISIQRNEKQLPRMKKTHHVQKKHIQVIGAQANSDLKMVKILLQNLTCLKRREAVRAKQEHAQKEQALARLQSGLRFSDPKLIFCIMKQRNLRASGPRVKQRPLACVRPNVSSFTSNAVSKKKLRQILKIQSCFRSHIARIRFATAFVKNELTRWASMKILSWRFHFRAKHKLQDFIVRRKSLAEKNKHAANIQKSYRSHLARLEMRFFRRCMPRDNSHRLVASAHQSSNNAALQIQKVWRGKNGRKKFGDAVVGANTQCRDISASSAAKMIQKAFRIRLARLEFAAANEAFCRTYFDAASVCLQSSLRCHFARKRVAVIQRSLCLMEQYAAKFAWTKTIQDLVAVAASEWPLVCAKAVATVGPQASFSHAQNLAPAVLPTWWLSHFPVSLSFRVDLKADICRAIEEQIRKDRINALGGAASFAKTLEMLASLVREVTESHLVSLSMSDSYSVLITLMAFCNIHGASLITSVDQASRDAGRDLLLYAERLADGPWFALPGLAERIEFRQWTQSNLCRMYYLQSEFEKAAQHARLLILSEQGVRDRDRLISVTAHIYLACAQSKLGKHLTATATLQQASEDLKEWCSGDAPPVWTTFCCTKELGRFYSCSPIHLAAVCQYNLGIEYAASNRLGDALQALNRAFSLVQQETQKESVFARRVKLSKIAIETMLDTYGSGAKSLRLLLSSALASPRRKLAALRSDSCDPDSLDASAAESRPTTARTYLSAVETEAANNRPDPIPPPCGLTQQSDVSKKRFGVWFPPCIALKNKKQIDHSAIEKSAAVQASIFDVDDETGPKRMQSLFLTVKHTWSPQQSTCSLRSPRKLSPLSKLRTPAPLSPPPSIVVISLPMESKDCFELICKESTTLYSAMIDSDSAHRLEVFSQTFRELSDGTKKIRGKYSGNALSRMMDLCVLCNRVLVKELIELFERGPEKQSSSILEIEKFLKIVQALWSGPMKPMESVKATEMRSLSQLCQALFYILLEEYQKAIWVLSDCISEVGEGGDPKIRAIFLLNIATCLSLLDRHKDSFEASFRALSILEQLPREADWFCYSASHNESEVTRHSWNPFAACCKYHLALESLFLGFEGPCLTFAAEAEELVINCHSPREMFLPDQMLLNMLKDLKGRAATKQIVSSERKASGGSPASKKARQHSTSFRKV